MKHAGSVFVLCGPPITFIAGETAQRRAHRYVWVTYKQAMELSGNVRKGERGSHVGYASTYVKGEEGEEQQIAFLESYTVFNAEQVDGLPAHFYALSDARLEPLQRIKPAEAFFADVPADIRSGGNLAYYNIGQDFVQLPPFEAFRDAESFYATKAHELAHWTRHEKRLNRLCGRKRWGDEGYAAEELVAELASAFLCADLGLTPEVRDDHASYIAH